MGGNGESIRSEVRLSILARAMPHHTASPDGHAPVDVPRDKEPRAGTATTDSLSVTDISAKHSAAEHLISDTSTIQRVRTAVS